MLQYLFTERIAWGLECTVLQSIILLQNNNIMVNLDSGPYNLLGPFFFTLKWLRGLWVSPFSFEIQVHLIEWPPNPIVPDNQPNSCTT